MKAIIFPGQGAQYPGMGKDLYDNNLSAKNVFLDIDRLSGVNVTQLCFFAPELELNDLYNQQLAVLATSLAAYAAFKEIGIGVNVDFFSGLSLGQYTCLYPAGVLALDSLVRLVKKRAEVTQKVSLDCPSSMLAVMGLERNCLEALGKKEGFYLANINSCRQIVISLKREDLEMTKNILLDCGAKIAELKIGVGFHSPLMMKAKKQLKDFADNLEFKPAKIPIVNNVTGRAHIDKDEIKKNLIEQLTSPVLWQDCVEFMIKSGVEVFFEIGPSRVLRGLIRKINSQIKVINIEKTEDLKWKK